MASNHPLRPGQRREIEGLLKSIQRLEAQAKRYVFVGVLCTEGCLTVVSRFRILGTASAPQPDDLAIVPLPGVPPVRPAPISSLRQVAHPGATRLFAPAIRRRVVPVVNPSATAAAATATAVSKPVAALPKAVTVQRRTTMAAYLQAGSAPATDGTAAASPIEYAIAPTHMDGASTDKALSGRARSTSFPVFDQVQSTGDFESMEDLHRETRGCLERTFFPIDMDSENQEVTYRVPYVMCIYFYASTMGLMACCCLLDGAQVSPLSG